MKHRVQRSNRTPKLKVGRWLLLAAVVVAVFLWGAHRLTGPSKPAQSRLASTTQPAAATSKKAAAKPKKAKTTTPKQTAAAPATSCADNTLAQNIIVSISGRKLWACDHDKTEYSSPVITGMEYLAADLTPTGTYHIYAKYTDTNLVGHDSTGSWDDHVSYWMPWLHNGYGTYGFHDATWRADSDFGNISPYSKDKDKLPSHGCVELPLATAKWLYGWASIGTTVTINA